MKYFVFVLGLFFGLNTHAQLTSHTSVALMLALGCSSDMRRDYWQRVFEAELGPAVQVAGGAKWYRASGTLYGQALKKSFCVSFPTMAFCGRCFSGGAG